jgi:tripartite-type tricarboxylate transporter receptor subunit TctC
MGGRIQALLASPLEVTGQVQSGRLRLIGVASAAREPSQPDLPTFAENGVPNFNVFGWFGLVAPAGVPAPIVQTIATEIRAVLAMPEVVARIEQLGAAPAPGTTDDFAKLLTAERRQWAEAVAAAGVRVE